MNDIEEALTIARTPEPQRCPECSEMLYSPMDKLSIGLYKKCTVHLEDDSYQEKNLLTLSQSI